MTCVLTASHCQIEFKNPTASRTAQVLAELGMTPSQPAVAPPSLPEHLPLQLDGRLVGSVPAAVAPHMVNRLRAIKAARLAATDRAAAALVGDAAVIELEV